MESNEEDKSCGFGEACGSSLMDRLATALFKIRYAALLAVIGSMVGALFLLFMGGLRVAYILVDVWNGVQTGSIKLEFIKTADIFLIGLTLMIFGLGIFDLFICDGKAAAPGGKRPQWLTFRTMDDLKNVLANVIVIILFITFFELILKHTDSFSMIWELLVIPLGVLLFAWGLRLQK